MDPIGVRKSDFAALRMTGEKSPRSSEAPARVAAPLQDLFEHGDHLIVN